MPPREHRGGSPDPTPPGDSRDADAKEVVVWQPSKRGAANQPGEGTELVAKSESWVLVEPPAVVRKARGTAAATIAKKAASSAASITPEEMSVLTILRAMSPEGRASVVAELSLRGSLSPARAASSLPAADDSGRLYAFRYPCAVRALADPESGAAPTDDEWCLVKIGRADPRKGGRGAAGLVPPNVGRRAIEEELLPLAAAPSGWFEQAVPGARAEFDAMRSPAGRGWRWKDDDAALIADVKAARAGVCDLFMLLLRAPTNDEKVLQLSAGQPISDMATRPVGASKTKRQCCVEQCLCAMVVPSGSDKGEPLMASRALTRSSFLKAFFLGADAEGFTDRNIGATELVFMRVPHFRRLQAAWRDGAVGSTDAAIAMLHAMRAEVEGGPQHDPRPLRFAVELPVATRGDKDPRYTMTVTLAPQH
jgi:hypothetical protein